MDKEGSVEKLTIGPAPGLRGEFPVPGDKSISHRAMILGAIADGVTEVRGFLDGEDTVSTLKAFESMGITVERTEPTVVKISGNGINGLKAPLRCDRRR